MLVRKHSLVGRLEPLEGEVAVQFHHGASGRHRVGAVNLDFVVALAIQRQRGQDDQQGELDELLDG